MNEKLILADGTELVGHGIETEARLFLYIYGRTLGDVFPLLNDPEKTAEIRAERYGEEGRFTGYGHLCSVSEERGGMICAGLKKN